MLYISGIHALNIDCNLLTTGDWHRRAIHWDVLLQRLRESENSIFGNYGIERNKTLSFIDEQPVYNVANHIRACLDLIEEGNFSVAQGMNNDFICNDEYDEEIFNKVMLLKNKKNWHDIDHFMEKEYKMKWLRFKKQNETEHIQNQIADPVHEQLSDKEDLFSVICDFLTFLNAMTTDFILKGDASLRLCCGLDRCVDNIELDSINKNIESIVHCFCTENNYIYRIIKETKTTKKYRIHPTNNSHHPLTITISYHKKKIDMNKTNYIKGVRVYTVDELFGMKMNAYNNRDKISDLYDVIYITKNYYDELQEAKLDMLRDILSYKGLEHLDYLISNQRDKHINNEQLIRDFSEVLEKLNLLDNYKIDVNPI